MCKPIEILRNLLGGIRQEFYDGSSILVAHSSRVSYVLDDDLEIVIEFASLEPPGELPRSECIGEESVDEVIKIDAR